MTTSEYDPACGIIKRHMTLQTNQVEAFVGCRNEGCVELLVLAGVVSAATFVVSGSIAVVGMSFIGLRPKANASKNKAQRAIQSVRIAASPLYCLRCQNNLH
jgi:hypothetical protein